MEGERTLCEAWSGIQPEVGVENKGQQEGKDMMERTLWKLDFEENKKTGGVAAGGQNWRAC